MAESQPMIETDFKVLIPLPAADFDPTETAVSWKVLREAGCVVSFATPDGQAGRADPLMVSGEGLDLWGRIPGLKKLQLIGLILRANGDARRAYAEMQADGAFQAPLRYTDLRCTDFDGLLIPGGHARGMRPYLENSVLQALVVDFFEVDKPVAAVCHGVVLLARSLSRTTGKSVLYGRKTTALTWPLERAAWRMTRYFGRYWEPNYYRTYPEAPGEAAGLRSVQSEVTRALAQTEDFLDVAPGTEHAWRKTCGLLRDSAQDARPAFVVRDGNYLSARWPGDVHSFARALVELLHEVREKRRP